MYDQTDESLIWNNQRIDSWKCTSTESLDKNKKTMILEFRKKQTEKVCGNRLR